MKKVVRLILALGLSWCVLVEVAESFGNGLFGTRVDGDWFLLIAASSWSELREFWSVYGKWITLAVTAIIALWALIWGMCCFARGRVWRCFLLLAVGYVGLNCRSVSHVKRWDPLYLAYDTVRSVAEYAEMMRAGRFDERSAVAAPTDERLRNLVVVIGESMTTDRMSLYGYEKPTTPGLDARRDELTVMPPVRPNYPDTVRSLRMMFTQADAAHPRRAVETSAVTFRKLGYNVSFIGAQPQWGRYCGVEHMLFGACNSRIYVNERQLLPDEVLVGYLERELSLLRNRPFVIFLQLTGSHFDPRHRVPPTFETVAGLDDYDRSICYTDHVLGQMIARLPANTTLIYVSDHGETPDAGRWRDVNNPSLWRVPVVIYPKHGGIKHIDSLDQVYWLLLRLAGHGDDLI